VLIIKSDYGLSEAGYDKIIEWTRNILPERNRLKENFENFCMLDYFENAEVTKCMTCGHSCYKPITNMGRLL